MLRPKKHPTFCFQSQARVLNKTLRENRSHGWHTVNGLEDHSVFLRSLGIAENARSETVQVKKGGERPKEVSKCIRLVGGRSRFQTCKGRGSSKPAVTHRWGWNCSHQVSRLRCRQFESEVKLILFSDSTCQEGKSFQAALLLSN